MGKLNKLKKGPDPTPDFVTSDLSLYKDRLKAYDDSTSMHQTYKKNIKKAKDMGMVSNPKASGTKMDMEQTAVKSKDKKSNYFDQLNYTSHPVNKPTKKKAYSFEGDNNAVLIPVHKAPKQKVVYRKEEEQPKPTTAPELKPGPTKAVAPVKKREENVEPTVFEREQTGKMMGNINVSHGNKYKKVPMSPKTLEMKKKLQTNSNKALKK